MNDGIRLDWKEACKVLGCKKTTYYKLIREGKLKSYGMGRRCRFVYLEDCKKLVKESASVKT